MDHQSFLIHLSSISYSDIYICKKKEIVFYITESMKTSGYEKPVVFSYDNELLDRILDNSSKTIYLYRENDFIYYGVLRLNDDTSYIIGPFSTHKADSRLILSYVRAHNLKNAKDYHIHTFSYYQAQSLLNIIYEIYNGEKLTESLEFPAIDGTSEFTEDNTTKKEHLLQQYQLDSTDKDHLHHPYQYEVYIGECIKEGNLDAINKLFTNSQANSYSSGIMALNTLKQEEYTTINAISLFYRSAIEGGVTPSEAYELSDLYLQQASMSHSVEEYRHIFLSALQDFIQKVQRVKAEQNQSVHTKKCKQYILRHLNKPFTLSNLAKHVGLNETYLSALFSQIEGITIQEFTQQERIKAAENMLKFSDYSISRIANYLCFQTQSHFGVMFKRYTGLTPGQYRKKNKGAVAK